MPKLAQCRALDLPDSISAHSKLFTHVFQGRPVPVLEPESFLKNRFLAGGQGLEHAFKPTSQLVVRYVLVQRPGRELLDLAALQREHHSFAGIRALDDFGKSEGVQGRREKVFRQHAEILGDLLRRLPVSAVFHHGRLPEIQQPPERRLINATQFADFGNGAPSQQIPENGVPEPGLHQQIALLFIHHSNSSISDSSISEPSLLKRERVPRIALRMPCATPIFTGSLPRKSRFMPSSVLIVSAFSIRRIRSSTRLFRCSMVNALTAFAATT